MNKKQVFRAGQSSGKSGSFFFFSNDKKFVIKTLQDHEKRKLLSILDSFIKHFVLNKDSLISRIYGIYTLMTDDFKPIDIIVMQSTAVLLD
jgi:1-phosphatidylinositol-4-phosphate 5-kinase